MLHCHETRPNPSFTALRLSSVKGSDDRSLGRSYDKLTRETTGQESQKLKHTLKYNFKSSNMADEK